MQSLVVFMLAALTVASASHWGAYPYPYYGGLAAPVVLPSGYLADTPEVAHAKSTHSARLASAAAAAAASPDYSDGYSGYYGYYGAPVVTPAGFLADTPEVAAAKAAHFAEVAKAGGAGVHVPYVPHVYAAGYEGHYVPDHNGW